MPIPDLDRIRAVIVPGLHDSGPEHWQTRWQRLYPSFERVEQEHWDLPDLDAWSAQVRTVLQRSSRPTLIIAHSFGCLASVHAHRDASNLVGALLVAPADPDKFDVAHRLRGAMNCPSIVVGSTNDPWMTGANAALWAQSWGSRFVNAGALGHINAESGLGDWREGQSLLAAMLDSAAPRHGSLQ